jgi:hypothetical protein
LLPGQENWERQSEIAAAAVLSHRSIFIGVFHIRVIGDMKSLTIRGRTDLLEVYEVISLLNDSPVLLLQMICNSTNIKKVLESSYIKHIHS